MQAIFFKNCPQESHPQKQDPKFFFRKNCINVPFANLNPQLTDHQLFKSENFYFKINLFISNLIPIF